MRSSAFVSTMGISKQQACRSRLCRMSEFFKPYIVLRTMLDDMAVEYIQVSVCVFFCTCFFGGGVETFILESDRLNISVFNILVHQYLFKCLERERVVLDGGCVYLECAVVAQNFAVDGESHLIYIVTEAVVGYNVLFREWKIENTQIVVEVVLATR